MRLCFPCCRLVYIVTSTTGRCAGDKQLQKSDTRTFATPACRPFPCYSRRLVSLDASWTRPSCFGVGLLDGFWAVPDGFAWYLDSADMHAAHQSLVYTTHAYQRAHCAYLWQKLLRALSDRRMLDSYNFGLARTQHCGRVLEEWENVTASMVVGPVVKFAYRACGEISVE